MKNELLRWAPIPQVNLWRTGKHVRGHTAETSLPYNYLPLSTKIKTAQTNKMIEQDQNTNRGHPPYSIQVYPVTQAKL